MFRRLSHVIFIISFFAVIVLSVVPKEAVPSLGFPDVLAHMAAYSALAFFGGITRRRARSLLIVIAGLVLFGAGLEVVQSLIPSRDANGYELLANVVGIALGSMAAISTNVFLKKLRNRNGYSTACSTSRNQE